MKTIKVNFKAEKNIMAIAWEIRTAAAIKWNCKRSEIVFGICLKMAWNGEEIEMEEKMESNVTKEIKIGYETGHGNDMAKAQKQLERHCARHGYNITFSCQSIKDELFQNTDEKFWKKCRNEYRTLAGLIKSKVYEMM